MKVKLLCVVVLLCMTLPSHVAAQDSAASASTPSTQSASTSDAAPVTIYTLPPDKLAKSRALYNLDGWLLIVGTVWSFVVLLAILYLRLAARYRDWAERAFKYSFPQAIIAVPLLMLTIDIPNWPLAAYRHSVSLNYGLSVQRWGSWFGDLLKGQAISLIVATLALWLMIFIIRRSPRRWWFYFWLIAVPFIFLFAVIVPYVIDPLFNKFEPLDKNHPELVTAIERVSHRGGLDIPRDRMFEMKASEKVTTLNAYVTGFGPSKRVVVWDTTIQKSTTPETQFVYGHEMGHYVLNHVTIGLVLGCAGLLVALYLLYRISAWGLRRFGARWQIRELGDWAALPMFFLIFAIMGFFSTPIENTVSRQIEHNADVYGLEVTHGINANSSQVAAHAFQILGELSLDYPYPSKLVVFWFYSHPTIADRVRFANEYDPWGKGQSPKYVR
jgi:Zn-dependent protease with chaperone function